MNDPAVEAAEHIAARNRWDHYMFDAGIEVAREALKPIRELFPVINQRYVELKTEMLRTVSSAGASRYANEMAGIEFVWNLIKPTIYTAEELG